MSYKKDPRTILDEIKYIVDCAVGQLYFLNIEEEDLETNQAKPIVLVLVESGGIQNYSEVQVKPNRIYDVEITILSQEPDKEFIKDQIKKKTVAETEHEFRLRINRMREGFCEIVEDIIYYLTDKKFPFNYDVLGDIDYSNVDTDETTHCIYGKTASFSIQDFYCRRRSKCDWDEDKIKDYKKNKKTLNN